LDPPALFTAQVAISFDEFDASYKLLALQSVITKQEFPHGCESWRKHNYKQKRETEQLMLLVAS
jgi:hypothetical protein